MKHIILIIATTLFIALSVNGQNMLFIGNQSFPCSKSCVLKPNSSEYYINDLELLFAKDGNKALLGVRTKTEDVLIQDELIIYLDDGNVITLPDNGNHDYVDKIASTIYHLDIEDLDMLKNSNINTVRYTLKNENGNTLPFGGSFSTSNKGHSRIDFPALVSEFFQL